MMNGVSNSFFPIDDLNIFSFCLADTCFDIINNRLRLFISRVIGCDDRQICQFTGHFSHLKPAVTGTVTTTAKQTYQTVRFIFSQCGKKGFQAHRIVCIIDHQSEIIRYLFHLDSALYFCTFQGFAYVFFRYVKMSADCNSRQRIVNTEFSRKIDLHRKIQQSLQIIGDSQHSFFCKQFRIDRAKVCLR